MPKPGRDPKDRYRCKAGECEEDKKNPPKTYSLTTLIEHVLVSHIDPGKQAYNAKCTGCGALFYAVAHAMSHRNSMKKSGHKDHVIEMVEEGDTVVMHMNANILWAKIAHCIAYDTERERNKLENHMKKELDKQKEALLSRWRHDTHVFKQKIDESRIENAKLKDVIRKLEKKLGVQKMRKSPGTKDVREPAEVRPAESPLKTSPLAFDDPPASPPAAAPSTNTPSTLSLAEAAMRWAKKPPPRPNSRNAAEKRREEEEQRREEERKSRKEEEEIKRREERKRRRDTEEREEAEKRRRNEDRGRREPSDSRDRRHSNEGSSSKNRERDADTEKRRQECIKRMQEANHQDRSARPGGTRMVDTLPARTPGPAEKKGRGRPRRDSSSTRPESTEKDRERSTSRADNAHTATRTPARTPTPTHNREAPLNDYCPREYGVEDEDDAMPATPQSRRSLVNFLSDSDDSLGTHTPRQRRNRKAGNATPTTPVYNPAFLPRGSAATPTTGERPDTPGFYRTPCATPGFDAGTPQMTTPMFSRTPGTRAPSRVGSPFDAAMNDSWATPGDRNASAMARMYAEHQAQEERKRQERQRASQPNTFQFGGSAVPSTPQFNAPPPMQQPMNHPYGQPPPNQQWNGNAFGQRPPPPQAAPQYGGAAPFWQAPPYSAPQTWNEPYGVPPPSAPPQMPSYGRGGGMGSFGNGGAKGMAYGQQQQHAAPNGGGNERNGQGAGGTNNTRLAHKQQAAAPPPSQPTQPPCRESRAADAAKSSSRGEKGKKSNKLKELKKKMASERR